MHALQHTYRGLGLVLQLNWDRFLFVGAIALALWAAAWIASF